MRKQLTFKNNIIDEYNIKSILILRQDRLGDVIVSEPFVRYLRKKHPTIKIDILLGNANYKAKFIFENYVNEILLFQKSILKDIVCVYRNRRKKYDLIIDLLEKPSRTSKLMIDLISPKYSAGLKSTAVENRYNFEIEKLERTKFHITERTSKLLELFGYNINTIELDYKVNLKKNFDLPVINQIKNEGKQVFFINLSGSSVAKYWGEENYIKFINLVKSLKNNYEFVLLYTKEYEEQAKIISKASGAVMNGLIGSFEEYIFTISKGDIILTPDTSAVHIASALKIKQIALYNVDLNKTFELEYPWLPYKSPSKVFGSETCVMKDISATEVFEEIKDFI